MANKHVKRNNTTTVQIDAQNMSSNKEPLKTEHLNAQSLQDSLEQIKLLMNERDVDILCVSETWLSSCSPDSYVNIQNYNLYRRDKVHGSGVCV